MSHVRRRSIALLLGLVCATATFAASAEASPLDCGVAPEPERWLDAGAPDVGRAEPIIAAHRGAAELAPENTLDAYRYAIAYGVEMIEVDVQQTLDGDFVSFHDSDVEAKTDGSGPIAAMSYAQVRELNAADNDKWRGSEYDPSQIPSLQEVLELAQAHGTGIYFDIKESVRDPAAVANMAYNYGLAHNSSFLTYDPARAAAIRAAHPDADIMLSNQGFRPEHLYLIAQDYKWFGSDLETYTAESIAAVHDGCGLVIPNVYDGDNAEVEARQLAEARAMGADGAQINLPDVTADALDEPVPTELRLRAGEICLVNADNGLGLPNKEIRADDSTLVTRRGGCVALPEATVETWSFEGDGSAIGTTGIEPESPAPTDVQPHEGQWMAGDLHVHTTYSGDSWSGPGDDNTQDPQDYYTLGHSVGNQFAIAGARGLDFVAITDHNDVRSQSDPGWGSSGVIGVPAYENSLDGHAQMLGAEEIYPVVDDSAPSIQDLADRLRADGGVFQINHPAYTSTDFPNDPDWKLMYEVQPDVVEVFNPSTYVTMDDGISYWEGWLDRGAKVGATGGSDSHWVSTTAVQGVGQPTTWVYSKDRTVEGILEGVRAGHTYISWQPPDMEGPLLHLEANSDGDPEFEAMMGDTVAPGSMVRARALGATGHVLRLVTDGGATIAEVRITNPIFDYTFKAPPGSTWIRAEVYDPDQDVATVACEPFMAEISFCPARIDLRAMTSALYLR